MKRLRLVAPAMSLGGLETTVCDPVSTSHEKVSAEVRERQGITSRLVRMSVGIEDCGDLVADLTNALEK
jgi:cystathionine beta-lyase